MRVLKLFATVLIVAMCLTQTVFAKDKTVDIAPMTDKDVASAIKKTKSGDTLTLGGSYATAYTFKMDIPSGVTVIWSAKAPKIDLNVSGSGKFVVADESTFGEITGNLAPAKPAPAPVKTAAKSEQVSSDEVSLGAAIKEAASRMENRMNAGTKIALINFSSPSNVFSEYVLDELSAAIVTNNKLKIVDRSNLDKVRSELGFNMSGEVSEASAQEIGKMAGAQAIVTGILTSIGDLHRISFKVIMTETAEVAVQYPADIINDKRVQALLAQKSSPAPLQQAAATKTASAAEAAPVVEAPAASATTMSGPPKNGTYTFFPRPRTLQGPVEKNVWLDRIVVRGNYLSMFFTGSAQGKGGDGDYRPFWSNNTLQDLDNPSRVWSMVSKGEDEEVTGGWYLTFEKVTARRLSLIGNGINPPYVFEEIIIGEPDQQ